ncbi:PUA-like domain-containing protein [Gymnopilus junonius]|uniref:PUA-like domain-containing protein n=1 Tax=Gymnopilus junonius TaxID=109634 RepID=A0A9P5NUF4_GYMJU|nr:PUA-like domain-containing protein [Gymnopilus junonius]
MAAERLRAKFLADTALYDPKHLGQDARFGPVERIPVLTTFTDRKECAQRGVHRATVAGISGSSKDGAYSICVSGGYEDDEDNGDKIIYTGTGGQPDPFSFSGSQTGDQSFNHKDNAALKISADTKKPVRVVRGPNKNSPWAPDKGYRYDGLYIVKEAYLAKGQSGYVICRYELERVPGQPRIPRKW